MSLELDFLGLNTNNETFDFKDMLGLSNPIENPKKEIDELKILKQSIIDEETKLISLLDEIKTHKNELLELLEKVEKFNVKHEINESENKSYNKGLMYIEKYNNSYIIKGYSFPYKNELKILKCKWNANLKYWTFDESMKTEIESFINTKTIKQRENALEVLNGDETKNHLEYLQKKEHCKAIVKTTNLPCVNNAKENGYCGIHKHNEETKKCNNNDEEDLKEYKRDLLETKRKFDENDDDVKEKIKHILHSHELILKYKNKDRYCDICNDNNINLYQCEQCNIDICVNCVNIDLTYLDNYNCKELKGIAKCIGLKYYNIRKTDLIILIEEYLNNKG